MLERGLDQAAGLRQMMAPPELNLLAFPLAANDDARWVASLARGLRGLGRHPVAVDAAGGVLAGAFGLRLRHDLLDLLEGTRDFDGVAQKTAQGVHVLRADRGVEAFVASGAPSARLMAGFARLSHGFDDLLLAMPASELACLAGPDTTAPVVGLDPTPQGVVQAYGLLKQLAEGFGYRRFACVVRGVDREADAVTEHARLAATAGRFLQSEVALAGWLPAGGATSTAGLARLARALLPEATAAAGAAPCLA